MRIWFCIALTLGQTLLFAQETFNVEADTKLILSARDGNIEGMKTAIKEGADINACRYEIVGKNSIHLMIVPIFCALDQNRKDIAQLLFDHGFELDKPLPNGERIIEHYMDSLTWALPYLVEHGADVFYKKITVSKGLWGKKYVTCESALTVAKDSLVRDYLLSKGAGERDSTLQMTGDYKDTVWLGGFVYSGMGKKPAQVSFSVSRGNANDTQLYQDYSYLGRQTSLDITTEQYGYFIFPIYFTRKEFYEYGKIKLFFYVRTEGYKTLVKRISVYYGNPIIIRLAKGSTSKYGGTVEQAEDK